MFLIFLKDTILYSVLLGLKEENATSCSVLQRFFSQIENVRLSDVTNCYWGWYSHCFDDHTVSKLIELIWCLLESYQRIIYIYNSLQVFGIISICQQAYRKYSSYISKLTAWTEWQTDTDQSLKSWRIIRNRICKDFNIYI